MQFLYPSFLWALLALAIPVIIHLFYFRRFKKVYFTNVKYLKEIKEETSSRNKLKNLLVLLSRCLAVAALVLAFAQPFVPTAGSIKSGINHVSVFVDNSYSMTAKKDDIPLVDYAKSRAKEIIAAYADEDKFQVLTHDFEGRHQRFVSKEDALTYVEEIDVTASVQTLSKVMERQKQLLDNASENRISYIISDFQKSISDFQYFRDTSIEVNLVPVQTKQQQNLTVDSVWFEGPVPVLNQNNKLVVRVKNNSAVDAEQVKLSFKKDGQDKPIGIRDIPANSYITDTIIFTVDKPGWHQGVVSVTDYPIQFDDDYFISFSVPDTIKSLFINESGPNKYMDALFNGVKNFSLTNQNANQLQYQQFNNYDLIILNDLNTITSGLSSEISQYIRNGGKVLLFPGKNTDFNTINQFLSACNVPVFNATIKNKREVSVINTEEFIFSDVFITTAQNLKLPVATLSYELGATATIPQEKLMIFRDGGSYLSKFKVGDGHLFVCSSPLDTETNDLVFNAEIFVPMVYKMAISATRQKNLAYFITNNTIVETDNKRKTGDYIYTLSNGNDEIIPGQIPMGNKINLDLDDQIRKSGFYELTLDQDIVEKIAFNYDRNESDMSINDEKALEGLKIDNIKVVSSALQADISGTISEKDKGIILWKWFIIATLIFLAFETLLLRFFKT